MMTNVIVAMSEDNAIGRDGEIPWNIPADMVHFKDTTMGSAVIMGRKTFDSIGKPLPGRDNIVVTRTRPNYLSKVVGVSMTNSLNRAIQWANADAKNEGVFIIGGAELYKEALPIVDRLYITRIIGVTKNADTFFPEFDEDDWELVSRQKDIEADGYCFETWEKPL